MHAKETLHRSIEHELNFAACLDFSNSWFWLVVCTSNVLVDFAFALIMKICTWDVYFLLEIFLFLRLFCPSIWKSMFLLIHLFRHYLSRSSFCPIHCLGINKFCQGFVLIHRRTQSLRAVTSFSEGAAISTSPIAQPTTINWIPRLVMNKN